MLQIVLDGVWLAVNILLCRLYFKIVSGDNFLKAEFFLGLYVFWMDGVHLPALALAISAIYAGEIPYFLCIVLSLIALHINVDFCGIEIHFNL